MDECEELFQFSGAVEQCRRTSSTTEKEAILTKAFEEKPYIIKFFRAAMDPFKQYYLTSGKADSDSPAKSFTELLPVLDQLASRKLSGKRARSAWQGVLTNLPPGLNQIAIDVLDKDLRCHVGLKILNKALEANGKDIIGEFNVALGNAWKGEAVWDQPGWFASRKFDGVRCLAVVRPGSAALFSRQGLPFETLNVLQEALQELKVEEPFVLDGELSLIDPYGRDDFQALMKEIRRKDHQIKKLRYHVFDCIPLDEFETGEGKTSLALRWVALGEVIAQVPAGGVLQAVTQVPITSQSRFDSFMVKADNRGWEGLILRRDVPYEGRRTKDLLKCKRMKDLEAEVIDTEDGPFTTNEDGGSCTIDVMSAAVIAYKGGQVRVGSGWTLSERKEFYAHPDRIIGKIITVQYFAETTNQEGGKSLRFPVKKVIHGKERTT